jgi:hypothetical protein
MLIPANRKPRAEPARPIRIQRRRTPGWRKPPNTVCVNRITKDRPGKRGNPFTVEEYGREEAIRRYREWIAGKDLSELRGKNLAC